MSLFALAVPDLGLPLRTILVALVCSIPCALLGCYLVLRRLSLLGDAISHAVLPGIALAFLLSGQISGLPIVVGAMALGILTGLLTQTVERYAKVPEDASMGVVFTSLFALGVILLSQRSLVEKDLDTNCVLYGLIEFTGDDYFVAWGVKVPVALRTLVPVFVLTLAFVLLLWKELKIASFDPALATAMGINAPLIHYLLMAMVAGVTVASFEAVGSILVVAMLIVPAACAHLLTDRLGPMMVWAAGVAAVSSVLGYVFAAALDTSMAGMMAVVAGVQFLLAVLLAPRHGVLSKVLRNWRLALRIAAEDVLARLYRAEERGRGEEALPRAVAPSLTRRLAVRELQRTGQIRTDTAGTMQLTEAGRRRAESLVRSHRLWEAYLGENFELPLDHLHEPAERMEHYVGPALQKELEAELRRPDVDPHGRPIPPRRDGV
ncbi:MAG TPA: metal ABC transporter permease [Gemmataceae bacterium]|nr:metal ABC transporter permease [Gemmataceae bacterium]